MIVSCMNWNMAISQMSEKTNVSFKLSTYDVFTIRCNDRYANSLQLIENKSGLDELDFFDSLSIRGSFFCITASIIDEFCMPLGLYLQDGNLRQPVNNEDGDGNFFLKPNGILLSDSVKVCINEADKFTGLSGITGIQSGPMLIIDGNIHPGFNSASKNKFTRCGAGIYKNNAGESFLVFAKSNSPVSFYDFASFFRDQYHCDNALHLESGDYISMHLPTMQVSNVKNTSTCRYFYLAL